MARKYIGIKADKMKIPGTLLGILAMVAGVLVLSGLLSVGIVIGIFLIVFGIIALVRR